MTIIEDLFLFIFFDNIDADPLPIEYSIISLLLFFGLSIFGIINLFRIYKAWKSSSIVKSQLHAVLLLLLSFYSLIFVKLFNDVIILLMRNKISVKISIFLILFIFIVLTSYSVIKMLVRVPKHRNIRLKAIKYLLIPSILSSIFVALMSYIPSISTDTPIITGILLIGLVINIVIFSIISITLYHEASATSSKIQRIRIKILSFGFLNITGTILGAGFNRVVINTSIGTPFLVFAYIFTSIFFLTSLGTFLSFYWAYFIPDWIRRRSGLGYFPQNHS